MVSDNDIAKTVDQHGWTALTVNDASPCYLYTVGVSSSYGHPELIILGLDSQVAYEVVANIARRVATGEAFTEPSTYAGVLEDYLVATRPVHSTQHELYLGYAMGHCRLKKIPTLRALQVFWPDVSGKFPFEPGCSITQEQQTRLDLPVPPSELAQFRSEYT